MKEGKASHGQAVQIMGSFCTKLEVLLPCLKSYDSYSLYVF